MHHLDETARAIIEHALGGGVPAQGELAYLLAFPPGTPEAALMVARARELGRRASGGHAFIHAQIGLDSLPCPKNCRFCSFAAANDDAAKPSQLAVAQTAAFARLFADEGSHVVSLMATAALPLPTLLEHVVAASEAVAHTEAIVLVNGPDLSLEQARELHAAGAQAAYHAVRLGEGKVTDIAPETRRATIANIRAAGLALMTGVEPVREGVSDAELAAAAVECRAFEPTWVGACRLTNAAGTAMEHERTVSLERLEQVGAAVRLAVGESVPVGGVGGVAWVDAGADPRLRGYSDAEQKLRGKMAAARSGLEAQGWRVPSQEEAREFLLGR